jgi:hypothetical protein
MSKRLVVTLEASGAGQVSSHFEAFDMEGRDVPGMLRDCINELEAEYALVAKCPANQPQKGG